MAGYPEQVRVSAAMTYWGAGGAGLFIALNGGRLLRSLVYAPAGAALARRPGRCAARFPSMANVSLVAGWVLRTIVRCSAPAAGVRIAPSTTNTDRARQARRAGGCPSGAQASLLYLRPCLTRARPCGFSELKRGRCNSRSSHLIAASPARNLPISSHKGCARRACGQVRRRGPRAAGVRRQRNSDTGRLPPLRSPGCGTGAVSVPILTNVADGSRKVATASRKVATPERSDAITTLPAGPPWNRVTLSHTAHIPADVRQFSIKCACKWGHFDVVSIN